MPEPVPGPLPITVAPPHTTVRSLPDGYITAGVARSRYGCSRDNLKRLVTAGKLQVLPRGNWKIYREADIRAWYHESLAERELSAKPKNTIPSVYVVVAGGIEYEYPNAQDARKFAADVSREENRPVPILERRRWNGRLLDTTLQTHINYPVTNTASRGRPAPKKNQSAEDTSPFVRP